MAPAPDGGKDPSCRGRPHHSLHVSHICATRNETGFLGDHPVPDGTRLFVAMIHGAQQIAVELVSKRRPKLLDCSGHFLARFTETHPRSSLRGSLQSSLRQRLTMPL